MVGSYFNGSSVPPRVRLTTTMIAGAWGLASAYTLFYSLLIKPNMRFTLIAIFPLVAVWAAIERKRWGRLALLGLSSAALGFFAASLGNVFAKNFPKFNEGTLNVDRVINDVLRHYNYHPQVALAVLILAAMTAYWMCLPDVRAEYERGKNKTLAIAQRAIAMTVVGCWSVTFLLPSETDPPVKPDGKKPTQTTQKKVQKVTRKTAKK